MLTMTNGSLWLRGVAWQGLPLGGCGWQGLPLGGCGLAKLASHPNPEKELSICAWCVLHLTGSEFPPPPALAAQYQS